MAERKATRRKTRRQKKHEPKEGCPFKRCPECGSTNIKWDGKDYVCMACGMVLTWELKKCMEAKERQRKGEKETRATLAWRAGLSSGSSKEEKLKKREEGGKMFMISGITFMVLWPATGIIPFLPIGAALFLLGLAMLKWAGKWGP